MSSALPGDPPASRAGGVSFFYGCLVDVDDDDHAVPEEYRATATLHEEARADATLATALRDWERLAGVPITEWISGARPQVITRYGFRP